MNRPSLSHEARKLLETDLDSLEKLDVLGYLRKAGGWVERTELVRSMQLSRGAMDALIGGLARGKLVETSDDRGAVRLGELAAHAACEELLRLYDEDRVLVVSALSSIAMERIRSMAVRTFGEVLVSKKKPSDNSGDP